MTGEGYHPERQPHKDVLLRPLEETDLPRATELAQNNIRKSFLTLFPQDVINAYLAANSEEELRHAANDDGTETSVLIDPTGQLIGFALIRFNPQQRRNTYGELDLRRLHVDENAQGQGLGKMLFEWMYERAKSPEINSEYVTSHASGSSRLFFEKEGWEGETTLNEMKKKGTSAIVFVAHKPVGQKEIILHNPPTHIIYAGGNPTKFEHMRKLIDNLGIRLPITQASAQEDEQTQDVFIAAKSKALSAAERLTLHGNINPLVIANDVRADLMKTSISTEGKPVYSLASKGKPKTTQELMENFRLLANTADITQRPAPYIIKAGTVLHSPLEPRSDDYSEHDVSIWISQEALEKLSTEDGIGEYIRAVNHEYGADALSMSAGLCLPYFLQMGFVEGINGHDIATLPKKDQVVEDAIQTAVSGINKKIIAERLGLVQI
jgi:GNAT superfamily N-acetyltransferase